MTGDILEVKERHKAELLRKRNVVGVGIGDKDRVPVIKVFVRLKEPAASLPAEDLIPETLEGHAVHVVEIGSPSALEQ